MARKKKLTRQQKIECTKKGECWKCNCLLKKVKNILKCENCGTEIVPSTV